METELIHLDTLLLGGVGCYAGPPGSAAAENGIERTRNRYLEHVRKHPDRPYSLNGVSMYEVHVFGGDTGAGGFEIFVGEQVNTALLPIFLCCKTIPESDYLKITLRGREIAGDWWGRLESVLLPSAGLRKNPDYVVRVYDERFKGMDDIESSEMVAYIPLEK